MMLGWALMFFAMALMGAAVGFGAFAATDFEPGQIAFVVFVVSFLVASILYVFRRRRPPI